MFGIGVGKLEVVSVVLIMKIYGSSRRELSVELKAERLNML